MKIPPTLYTPISEFMTVSPLRIEETTSLHTALDIMHKSDIRHLPVLHGGKLVGLVSHRDITARLAKGSLDPEQVTVKAIMKEKPYTVAPSATLYDVTGQMIHYKYGSVIIVEAEKVVGIFTSIDAMRVLREICRGTSKYTQ